MRNYAALLRTPGVARLIAAQLTARFPGGMLSLAYLLHVEHLFGSYGAAGLVLAAASVGQAIAGPLTGRFMGIWGMRPVLVITTTVCAASMLVMAYAPLPLVVGLYMVVGFVGGLSMPPIQSAVRTIYPKMVTSDRLGTLFTLDASVQELIWIAGPVLVTFVSTQLSTQLGILIACAFLVGGGAWFIASPEVGKVRIPRSKRRFGLVLTRPPVLLAIVVGTLLIGSCSALEASVVAQFGEGGAEAGIVLAIWSVASLAGGLVFGDWPMSRTALARRMFLVALGSALTLLVGFEFWSVTATLLIAGLGIAPSLAVMSAMVASSVRFSDTAEAYGWVATGQLIGAGAGSAVAGFLIDGGGAHGGYIAAVAFGTVGFLAALVFHRAAPDLRVTSVGPRADTEPVPVQPS